MLAISSPSDRARIEHAAAEIEAAGCDVVLAGNIDHQWRPYLAGDDQERLSSLNNVLRDPSFDLVLFARGGYGAMRILDGVDYEAAVRMPRPIVGFSDVTALHEALARKSGLVSFHGPMLNTDFHGALTPERQAWFWEMLRGKAPLKYSFQPSQIISPGRADGTLFGGCLSLTTALAGTGYGFWIDDGIWFWEDVSEPTYRIDRMLTRLRLSGKLRRVRGVMIGKLKECGGADIGELDSLLTEFFSGYGIPVVRDLPFGHHGDNLLLPIGVDVQLDTDSCSITFPEPVVQERRA